MRITNLQKKELSDIFQKLKLNIHDFKTSGQYKEFKIEFKFDYFSFSINKRNQTEYNLTIYPVDNKNGYSVGAKWENVLTYFEKWAKAIKSELSTPTGWETFDSENYMKTEFSDLKEKFSVEEQELIKQNLKELTSKIKQLELNEEVFKTFETKLDELSKKVDKLNKFDWKSLFIGTIVSLLFTFGLPPETSGFIWELVKTTFSRFQLSI